jgi:endonuclease/exonuclease/phosphatase family metal-dependent hydrolase
MGDLNLAPEAAGPVLSAFGLHLAHSPAAYPALAPAARIDHLAGRQVRIGPVTAIASDASDHLPLVANVEIDDL